MYKKIICIIIVCVLIVILTILSIFIFSKQTGKTAISFEKSEISYIKDNKDYAKFSAKNIDKIEISSNNSYRIVKNSNEIKNIVDRINSYEGYKISADKVPLETQLKLVFYMENSTLEMYISSETISINTAHYKTTENYKESLERLYGLQVFY